MCRYIFVGFHMELVLKCAKMFFFLKCNGKKSSLIQMFSFFSPLRKLIIMCEINCAKQLAF